MSIINHEDEVYKSVIGSDCFYCSGPVYPPGVYWVGSGGELLLHAPCVMELGLRLGRDVLEVEKRTRQYFAPGEVHTLRTRLVASEMWEGGHE